MNNSSFTDALITTQPRLTARQWEISVASEWLEPGKTAHSDRQQLATNFTNATIRFFKRHIATQNEAGGVVSQLRPTLERCDELTFDDSSSAFAYLLWHQVDRYHRVSQALDQLFASGQLPLAKPERSLRILEVGSGPAPASYASVDYYAALAAWTASRGDAFQSSPRLEVHTLDRGSAWKQIIHGLSEELSTPQSYASRNRFFGVTYPELAGFNPAQLHVKSRESMRRKLLNEEDDWSYERHLRQISIDQQAARAAPPSAYDLIIVANFVTNSSMMVSLKNDLENLAKSLVPGGVLLTLSGHGKQYKDIWDEYATWPNVKRLDHTLDKVIRAHEESTVHARVAQCNVELLEHLSKLDRPGLDQVKLPPDIASAMSVARTGSLSLAAKQVDIYPNFQLHAFVRRNRAMTSREQNRIVKGRLA